MALKFRQKRYYYVHHSSFVKRGRNWHGEVYGVCPVQGDGEINGYRWYFRARGSKWSFEIYGHPNETKMEPWGDWPDAGYMSHAKAWKLITESLNAFKHSSLPKVV